MASDIEPLEASWPVRAWLLAVLGALLGLAIERLGTLPDHGWDWGCRIVGAAMIFLGVGGLAFALSWRRGAHFAAAIAALICGAVAGGVLLWNGLPGGEGSFWSWQLLCGFVAAGFVLVMFQAAQGQLRTFRAPWTVAGLRDWTRRALVYADIHEAIWSDALLIGASLIFSGIAFGVAELLAAMFALVKLDFLRDLLRHHWVDAMLLGASLGVAISLLRERAPIISALQRVVMIVLRVLAPVLAVGLAVFLAVLPFTGLAPLWATGNTTPLMLSATLVALLLVNAVIADRGEEAATARVLRWGAAVLGLALAPLVAIAAWSTGLRIGQRGLSPDRLWALTFIILACVTAIAYAVAILRRGDWRQGGWIGRLHRSNLHLAFILGGVSLLLSTSLVSFERIATANQLARLASGRVSAQDFDYRALWFDFGPPGRAAIRRLARESKSAQVRRLAGEAQKLTSRFDDTAAQVAQQTGTALDQRLTILPRPVPLDPGLRKRLVDYDACGISGLCLLRYVPGEDHAIAIALPAKDCRDCPPRIRLLYRGDKGWSGPVLTSQLLGAPGDAADQARMVEAVRTGKIELRTVERRQLFVDGKPIGEPIPMENAAEP